MIRTDATVRLTSTILRVARPVVNVSLAELVRSVASSTHSEQAQVDGSTVNPALQSLPARGPLSSEVVLNQNLLHADYAVRGPIVLKATMIEESLAKGSKKYPFTEVIQCNIGNPQALKQPPLTFPRQISALTSYTDLIDDPAARDLFPEDAIERARKYISSISGGIGAYQHSQGVEVVRDEVAAFIAERDGVPASGSDVFLTDGASPSVQMAIRAIIRGPNDGILVPIPQYPLYSASIRLNGGKMGGYFLDEEKNWGLDFDNLEETLYNMRAEGTEVRAMAVINPGNPTGNILTVEQQKDLVQFCCDHQLVLLADEVYQENIWKEGLQFTSFKKVAAEMGKVDPERADNFKGLQLISFHSISKGFMGECGRRGGYMELLGFDETVLFQLYKLSSISLCANVPGMLGVGCMVNPPRPGEESYELYSTERDNILESLRRRALMVYNGLNAIEGVSCQNPMGAMYAFPRIDIPEKAVQEALSRQQAPDFVYCMKLLRATGITVVPGTGFGQRSGEYHFRTTILPPEDKMEGVLEAFAKFHEEYMASYK